MRKKFAENKSFPSQRGTEAGGSSTIQSSVEQKPSEACTSEQMQVLLMNLSEQGGKILETEIRVVKMKQLLFIVQRENRLDET